MKIKRFQEVNWLIKLWRLRYYLTIPWYALKIWLRGKEAENWDLAWSISLGMAQFKMKWYFTQEEMEERWVQRGLISREELRENKRKNLDKMIGED